MLYYIPFEIQAEIMIRLPVKSLIRFKSISKVWKSFIQSSKFIADYNTCHPQHHLLVTFSDYNGNEKYVSIVDDDAFPLCKLSHSIPRSVNLLKNEAICGSSQGLLCFYGNMNADVMAVIWNPSIRKSVDIVLFSKLNWSYDIVVGFGVCPRTFDPMLVKMIKSYDPDYYDHISGYAPRQVEVFTLSSGAWKSLSINLPRESIWFTQHNSMDLDGFIYWHAQDGGYNLIMSFDMTRKTFIEISLPDCLVDARYTHLSISKRMESLVVLEYNSIAKKQVCIVWMMESGVHKSFTKLFTIEAPEASIRRVLGFRKSGEPIIEMSKSGPDKLGVYLYEPNSRHISYSGISSPYLHKASSYTNTLLLLDR